MADLAVIGSGPGGVAAALSAATAGAAVTLIERANLGGTCVNAGCIPAGALHHTVSSREAVLAASRVGVEGGSGILDWQQVHTWMGMVVNEAVARTRSALAYAGVEVVRAGARFLGPQAIEVDGRTLAGLPIVVATGARSALPVFGGASVLGNDEAMALNHPPGSLVILGADRFSIEWADVFAAAGTRVTVVSSSERILPAEDADLAGFLQMILEERGVRFLLGTKVEEVDGPTVVAAGGLGGGATTQERRSERLEAEAILSPDLRVPNVVDLGLEVAGIAMDDHGGIAVDQSCRTSAEGVYAAGDVTGPPWLSNRARAQGEVAAVNALGGSAKVRPERIPRSVNAHPVLAAVGRTEEQALAEGIEVGVGLADLSGSMQAVILGDPRGALKLVVDREFGEILGGHMVGARAEEVIAQVVVAMEAELDYRELAKSRQIHPSMGELLAEAAAAVE